MGDQKVVEGVVNHMAKNSVKELSILEHGNIYGSCFILHNEF